MKHNYNAKWVLILGVERKDGKKPIYLQVRINGELKRIKTGFRVLPSEFNGIKAKVNIKGEKELTLKVNAYLKQRMSRVQGIFADAQFLDESLTLEKFIDLYENPKVRTCFFAYVEQKLADHKLQASVAHGTYKSYLRDFKRMKGWRTQLAFDDISLNTIYDFDRHLKAQKTLSPNSVMGCHKFFKKWLNEAARDFQAFENPYLGNFAVKHLQTKRVFLTPAELGKYVDAYKANRENKVLRMFLFMCFTGLRISDMKKLVHSEVHGSELWFRPKKTEKHKLGHRVPLNKFAQQLIQDGVGQYTVFDAYKDDNVFGRHLRAVTKYLGIQKRVTSHVGRHTYATMFLRMGGKVEVLKEILGHRDIGTTMIYVHIVSEQIQKQNAIFDEMFQLCDY